MSAHPAFGSVLSHFGGTAPPVDASIARIRELEALNAELARKLAFQHEATAQFVAKYEEVCPSNTTAELPNGDEVIAPAQVIHDAMIWLREKYILEWCARVDDQSLLHFAVDRAELRLAAQGDL